MGRKSAGLLVHRETARGLEVFLVHPGGPMWAKKDEGAWSIPKGEFEGDEDPLAAAKREFAEETGFHVHGDAIPLEPLRQPSAKIVYAWALRGDLDATAVKSNMFSMEWPPKSGRRVEFPEVDRAAWFTLDEAREKLLKGQVGFLDELESKLTGGRVRPGRDEAAS
ncbi:MAG: NUDIX domain-containing protein [Planctomycetota bacterium]